MKILLVKPPLPRRAIGAAHASLCEPLELEVLAGNLRDHDTTLLDMRVDPEPFDSVLERVRPDLVGVTANTMEVRTAQAVLRRVKEVFPAVATVVGGPHATARPQDFAGRYVQAIVVGQGVATFKELVEARERGRPLESVPGLVVNRENKQTATAERAPAASLGDFPAPDRRAVRTYTDRYYHAWVKPVLLVQGSFGATSPGTVGAQPQDDRVVQDVERVAAEMVEHDAPICMADDDALAEPTRIARLCALLKEAKFDRPIYLCCRSQAIVSDSEIVEDLAEIGLAAVALALSGTESGGTLPEQRRAVEILHDHGISVSGEFQVYPEFDADEIRQLGVYARQLEIEFPIFASPTPFPGTKLFAESQDSLGTPDWEIFDRVHCVVPTRMPLRAFYEEVARLYERAYGLMSIPRMSRSVPYRLMPNMALQLRTFIKRVRRAHLDQESELHHMGPKK